MRLSTFVFLSLIQVVSSFSQSTVYTVIDEITKQPVPYATIQTSENQGVYTNEEGRFSFATEEYGTKTDSIYVSSMGYERRGIALAALTDSTIYIRPQAIALDGAFISNKKLTVDEIIEQVKENLEQNYSHDLSQKRFFLRKSDFGKVRHMNIDFKKSTIEEFDKKFLDSVVALLPKKSEFYSEVLGDFYKSKDDEKLTIIKAAKLYDKNNEGSFEALGKKVEQIFKENVKPTSYLKIKSGFFFGTKVQVDSILKASEEAKQVKTELEKQDDNKEYVSNQKSNLKSIFENTLYNEDSKLDILHKFGRYDFELTDYSIIDGHSVYVIQFIPGRRADFKGTLYVNTEDFAVVRIDYENTKTLKNFGLLGLSYKENVYKGRTIFSKETDHKYHLKFLEKYQGNIFGVDRPLKIIEKNKHVKGKRKQNELSLGIDVGMSQLVKTELVIFSNTSINDTQYQEVKEDYTIEPEYLSKYDPDFWNGHTIMEPNTAIRSFEATEGL
ncbi:carboxypeptidase-like regulatory domain-containing protein [Aquimarina intermedia]|uniref:Carboxypeptidase-like protein n=1 Tax=Aquimarina intermedia TaxID=350814 RepID=A0A5S5CA63_9FLAO|nr:carboxypeptidase-like regulatory domain-containing protein [Aquimarina intermedia]TYP76234.1 carboxypeptidase-like protein [Aquimarina intermedia]